MGWIKMPTWVAFLNLADSGPRKSKPGKSRTFQLDVTMNHFRSFSTVNKFTSTNLRNLMVLTSSGTIRLYGKSCWMLFSTRFYRIRSTSVCAITFVSLRTWRCMSISCLHLMKIHNNELPQLPPFNPNQAFKKDKLSEIILFGVNDPSFLHIFPGVLVQVPHGTCTLNELKHSCHKLRLKRVSWAKVLVTWVKSTCSWPIYMAPRGERNGSHTSTHDL